MLCEAKFLTIRKKFGYIPQIQKILHLSQNSMWLGCFVNRSYDNSLLYTYYTELINSEYFCPYYAHSSGMTQCFWWGIVYNMV